METEGVDVFQSVCPLNFKRKRVIALHAMSKLYTHRLTISQLVHLPPSACLVSLSHISQISVIRSVLVGCTPWPADSQKRR